MDTITVKDKEFRLFIREQDILKEVKRVAAQISHDYIGRKPLFLCVLNGSFMFASDLMKEIDLDCSIHFVKLASYEGVVSTGKVREVIGINQSLKARDVIVIEDIVDTGVTMEHMLETLGTREPNSIQVCTLLCKPGKMKVKLDLKYVAMNIPDDFIVGYGLDYDGYGRNYRDIYKVCQD